MTAPRPGGTLDNPYLDLWQQVQRSAHGPEPRPAFPDLDHLRERLAWDDLDFVFETYERPLFPMDWLRANTARDILAQAYAWAVPSTEAIDAIAALGPQVVEIGAGTGYWASLLARRGVMVHAYDIRPRPLSYHPVQFGTYTAARQHPDATLLLCWPPMGEPMAYCALREFQGQHVAYVGEGGGGCTGDDEFHDWLDRHWTLSTVVGIPQWNGIHDRLFLYRRATSPGSRAPSGA